MMAFRVPSTIFPIVFSAGSGLNEIVATKRITRVDSPIITYSTLLSMASRKESFKMAKYFMATSEFAPTQHFPDCRDADLGARAGLAHAQASERTTLPGSGALQPNVECSDGARE